MLESVNGWSRHETAKPTGCVRAASAPQTRSDTGQTVPAGGDRHSAADRYDCDVAIVGAGMAGLAAAKTLMARGLTVQVIEADSRIGGRARAVENVFATPIDVGCSWLHDAPHNALTPVVDAMGLKRHDTDYFSTMFVNGHAATAQETKQFNQENDQFLADIAVANQKGLDLPANALLPGESRFGSAIAFEYGPMDTAAEIEKSSSLEVGSFSMGEDSLVEGTLAGFVQRYGADVPVRLNTPVKTIHQDSSGVDLETGAGEHVHAREAIVTVSTGVLAHEAIRFEPALPPSTKKAIEGLPMGHLEKIILQLDPKSLEEVRPDTWVVNHEDNREFGVDFLMRPMGQPIVMAFVGGDEAVRFDALPKDERLEYVQQKLERIYPQTHGAFIRGEATTWATNPLTYGSYSAALPGRQFERDVLREAVGHVRFAGEITARPEVNASLPGAYEEGIRAANEVADLLGAPATSAVPSPALAASGVSSPSASPPTALVAHA